MEFKAAAKVIRDNFFDQYDEMQKVCTLGTLHQVLLIKRCPITGIAETRVGYFIDYIEADLFAKKLQEIYADTTDMCVMYFDTQLRFTAVK